MFFKINKVVILVSFSLRWPLICFLPRNPAHFQSARFGIRLKQSPYGPMVYLKMQPHMPLLVGNTGLIHTDTIVMGNP